MPDSYRSESVGFHKANRVGVECNTEAGMCIAWPERSQLVRGPAIGRRPNGSSGNTVSCVMPGNSPGKTGINSAGCARVRLQFELSECQTSASILGREMVAVKGGERRAGGVFVSFKAVTIRWRPQLPRLRRSLFPPRFSAIRLLHLMSLAPICAAPAAWFNRSVHTTRLGRVVFLTRSLRSTSTWSAKATECARQRTSDQSSSGKNL